MTRSLPAMLAVGCLLLTGLLLGCQPAGNSGAGTTGSGTTGSESASSKSGTPPPPPGATAAGTAASAPANDAGAALMAAYRQAHQQKDVDGLLALYELQGASADMRETIRENIEASLAYPITNIAIGPAPPGEHGPRTEGAIRWRPSLEVTHLLTIDFDTSRAPPDAFAANQLVLTVGEKGGRYLLTAPVRE
jgi:hypothetical protein